MTRREPLLGLWHMLDAAREAVAGVPEIVLRTISEKLPPLIRQLETALGAEGGAT